MKKYIIAKMEYNRHWPKELHYGQYSIDTLQLSHLYMKKIAQYITTLERTLSSLETAPLIQNVIETY